MNNEKLWLLVDSTLKKLLHAQHWTTSIDSYKEDIDQAVKSLKKAKHKDILSLQKIISIHLYLKSWPRL